MARTTSGFSANRCFNSAGGALSAQPIFGGPLYFYDNLVYGATTGGYLKLVDTPAGVLFYQNTFVGQVRYYGPAANVHFRNNLILGDGWGTAVFGLAHVTPIIRRRITTDSGPNPGGDYAFEWDSPALAAPADYAGKLEMRRFGSLQELQRSQRPGPAQRTGGL